jgi:hypothetical protein
MNMELFLNDSPPSACVRDDVRMATADSLCLGEIWLVLIWRRLGVALVAFVA